MRAHGPSVPWSWVGFRWGQTDGRCSECGSIMPEEAVRRLTRRGTSYLGSDWQFGWPSEMTLDGDKFFPVHLAELDDHEIEQFAALTWPMLGVAYSRDESGIDYRAARRGFQARGIVGDPGPMVSAAWARAS